MPTREKIFYAFHLTLMAAIVIVACSDDPLEPVPASDDPHQPSEVVRSWPDGCVPDATTTFEDSVEIITINFNTSIDTGCVIDASPYGVDMADPTGVDTPQGTSYWTTNATWNFQNLPSSPHAAIGINNIFQNFIEIDPPARSVKFHYATDVAYARWGGDLQEDPDSMWVGAGARQPGTVSYTWWDNAILYANIDDLGPGTIDTWDTVTLNAPWDAINIVWFEGNLAIDDLEIIRSAPPGVVCDSVVRGSSSTCTITRDVDSVLEWTFRAPLPYRLFDQSDSVIITNSTTGSTWSGKVVLSGEVSARVTMNGGGDTATLVGALAVTDRSSSDWRWDESDWLWTDSTSNTQCDYEPFYLPINPSIPNAGRLAVNRPTPDCTGLVLSSVAPYESPDTAFTIGDVQEGPNEGLHYVTSAGYYMDHTAEMNPFLASASSSRLTLSDRQDVKRCQDQPDFPENEPVVANFWEYNEICRQFGLSDFYTAIWKHEGFGTQDSTSAASANGHQARRWIGARQPENDPNRQLEQIVNPDSAFLWAVTLDSIDKIDDRLNEAADPDHAYVRDNYMDKNRCGQIWAMDTTQNAYTKIQLEQTWNGQSSCF